MIMIIINFKCLPRSSLIYNGLPNLEARSLSAEISEKVQPPRNMTSLHFDPGDSFVLESVKNKNRFLFRVLGIRPYKC